MVTGFHIGITENSQDLANNTSNVTVALTITWNGGSFNATGNASGVLTVDGVEYPFKAKFNSDQKTSGSEVFYSQTLTVAHNEDGSKSLPCEASFATGTMVGTVTAAATKELTPIPRESTAGATDANIGAVSLISINRKNAEYTHSVAYAFGNLSGYLADGDGTVCTEEKMLTATGIAFLIPVDFYEQIPDSKSGICTLTVRTYSGSTQIGTDKTCSFTVTAGEESCRPEIDGTVVDINESTLALTGDENKLVRGMSTARCTVIAHAKNGASLVKRTVDAVEAIDGERIIPNTAGGSFQLSATDSRGYTGTLEKSVETVAYVLLTCNCSATRTDPTSGNGLLSLSGNYFDGSFGARDNALHLSYQINDGDPVELTPQIEDNRYTATANLSGLDYRQAHTITVTAQDQLITLTKQLTVGKGIPVFDWGEEDFRFNVPVSVMGIPVGNTTSAMEDPDTFLFDDNQLHIGCGSISGEGYISFNIGVAAVQWKISADNEVFIRSKYGQMPWSQWTLVAGA